MQYNKAGPIGEEVRKRRSFGRKRQCTVTPCVDLGGVADRLIFILAGGLITDRKAIFELADLQVLDCRSIGAPVLVADDKRNSAQDFFTVIADVAQGAAVENC